MKTKKYYYVSRKSGLTWLMVLCLTASAVIRITNAGLKGIGNPLFLWSHILPAAAALLYVFITLKDGEERFYRTAIPVWMTAAYFAYSIIAPDLSRKMTVFYWITLLIAGILYVAVTASRMGKPLFIVPMLACLAIISYLKESAVQTGNWEAFLAAVPDLLMLLGLMTLIFALHLQPDTTKQRRWGDRIDGRRIRSLEPMAQMIPYIMVSRNTAVNTFEDAFEISQVEKYIRQKRNEGLTSFGIVHVLLASYVRGISRFPAVNRFIAGQRIYSRENDIQFCMVVKKDMNIDSPDTVIKVHLTPADTAEEVYRKMNEEVEKVKNTPLDSSFDNLALGFTRLPSLLLKFVIWLLKCLDYFGLLPQALLELSPFHGSLFFTSMGSLGIPPVYHHLYDFGNLPIFIAFGCKRREYEVQKDGSVERKLYVDCKFTMDERITDGFYFASFYKYFKRLFLHPEILDTPPEEIVKDIE